MPAPAHRLLVAALSLVALPAGDLAKAVDASSPSAAPAASSSAASLSPVAAPSSATPTTDESDAADATWLTGPDIGAGVAMKDTGNARGKSAFIGYAGYGVGLEDAEAWVDALDDAWLEGHGVRYLWAVRGPDDSHYENKEIGNTKIVAKLRTLAEGASFILVAAHSSGSCVAHELFAQLAEGRDPEGTTAGKIVYFDLDGIEKGLTPASVARLRRAYFVGAVDRSTDTVSPNQGDMRRTAALYAASAAAGYLEHDAEAAKCARGGRWCLHVSLVNNAPHDARAARAHLDYSDFATGGVATAFFEEKAAESGMLR